MKNFFVARKAVCSQINRYRRQRQHRALYCAKFIWHFCPSTFGASTLTSDALNAEPEWLCIGLAIALCTGKSSFGLVGGLPGVFAGGKDLFVEAYASCCECLCTSLFGTEIQSG